MNLIYKNNTITLTPDESTGFEIVIQFGDTVVYDETVTETQDKAIALAKQFIDEFCLMLPPALSYKHFNDADN